MKKRCLLCLLLALLWGCTARDPLAEISDAIGADVRGGNLAWLTDSETSFHGDGETLARILLTREQAASFLDDIQGSAYWHPLPLSGNLSAAIYGCRTDSGHFGPLFPADTVPPVEHGCWFFEDRHSQAADPSSDAQLHSRGSWNFTAAIFDADQNIVYVLILDT